MYGPCREDNPTSFCIRDSRCLKKFSKRFQEAINVPDDVYPVYKRWNTGKYVIKKIADKEVKLNNRSIVFYNLYLFRKYRAHINVEIYSSIKAVKYINKYIYKGNNIATIKFWNFPDTDKVTRYLQGRYVSLAKSVVQLFKFSVYELYPPVTRLPVHLKG